MRHYDVSQALFFPARRVRGIRAPFLRALLRPMAIACLRDLTRCLPERMWCISVRTERLPFAELFDRRGIGNLVSVENRHGSLGWQFEETERLVAQARHFSIAALALRTPRCVASFCGCLAQRRPSFCPEEAS